MERVQLEQEQMLAELKDLVQKGLFTRVEVKQILRKRTQLETTLVRRVAKKSDFLRYAAYEMGLEQLRRKRFKRLNLPKTKATISDYALVRRQYHIFERALKRFRADVGLWIQYIQLAKRHGAHRLVGRITGRALQLHPSVPSLYIIAASHELSRMSPAAARALLQRGLRLNGDSIDLWKEYVRMELHFIEGMRRRWDVLGITLETGKDQPLEVDDGEEGVGDPIVIDEGEKPPDEVAVAEKEGDDGEAARRAIVDGAIVKSVMSSAAQAVPRINLFTELESLLRAYPCQPRLRAALLDELYSLLRRTIPDDPKAVKMLATRRLGEITDDGDDQMLSQSERLVDALQYANEQLVDAVNGPMSQNAKVEISRVYIDFVEEWCRVPTVDESLKQYLIASLHTLAQKPDAPPVLQATHVRLLLRNGAPCKKILKLARRYSLTTNSPEVWLARLDAEKTSDEGDVSATWASARSAVQSCADKSGVEKVWLWGLDHSVVQTEDREALFERLLKQTIRDSSNKCIHETLLLRYVSDVVYADHVDAATRRTLIRRIPTAYLPTPASWERLFSLESAREEGASKAVLSTVYEHWQAVDLVRAVVAWAGWLMDHGEGKEAVGIMSRSTARLLCAERDQLEQLWNSRLNAAANCGEDEGEENDEEVFACEPVPMTLTIE